MKPAEAHCLTHIRTVSHTPTRTCERRTGKWRQGLPCKKQFQFSKTVRCRLYQCRWRRRKRTVMPPTGVGRSQATGALWLLAHAQVCWPSHPRPTGPAGLLEMWELRLRKGKQLSRVPEMGVKPHLTTPWAIQLGRASQNSNFSSPQVQWRLLRSFLKRHIHRDGGRSAMVEQSPSAFKALGSTPQHCREKKKKDIHEVHFLRCTAASDRHVRKPLCL